MMPWTTETPTRNGYYLWRICFPDEPPTVEPFMIYELPDGVQRVQELSSMREQDRGMWTLSEWLYRDSSTQALVRHPTQYLLIGSLDTEWLFIKAFRELYHEAATVRHCLVWEPDIDNKAMIDGLAAAIDAIHKEN